MQAHARSLAVALALVMVGSCEPTASAPPHVASPQPLAPAVAVQPIAPPAVIDPPQRPPRIDPPWTDEDLPRIRKYQPLVRTVAQEYGLDPHVLNAIIWHESKFHANARGPGGAAGLMQLMPSTSKAVARKLGRANKPYDPKYNVAAGAWLLHRLLEIFEGDEELALAGYALGSGAVRKRLEAGEPLPDKTQRFIRRVDEWSQAFASAEQDLKPGTASRPHATSP